MIDLAKKILQKVSFDPILFRKELIKSLLWIRDIDEFNRFKEWCQHEFGKKHPSILQEIFLS
ncbi:MAG: hypothetical protein FJX84_07565 [Bacteroidetes bacterium]|nr:hypothetical protein [Bacteroidota bacterium]